MFNTKIKLDKDLFLRCKQYAETKGYSSIEEFVTHTLEKELRNENSKSEDVEDERELTERLKGLGYIE